MADKNEELSCLMDEYTSNNADRQLLGSVLNDVNLQYRLKRYQLIGEVMRHQLPEQIDNDFSHNVMSKIEKIQIENKPKLSQTKAIRQKITQISWRWELLKPFAGMSIAAFVGFMSIILWQSVFTSPELTIDNPLVTSNEQQKINNLLNQSIQIAVPASTNPNTLTEKHAVPRNGLHWQVIRDTPALERKLNAYLINHMEHSGSLQGLISQARVAGYQSEE